MSRMLKQIAASLLLALLAIQAFAQSEYKVRPGDTLSIEVLEDNSLNRTVVVLPDGRFSFPFAGSLRARGQTVGQIQDQVTQAISSNFASGPTVFVSVNPAPPEPVIPTAPARASAPLRVSVYLLGEVSAPGLKEVRPGTTFLQALSQAGVLTQFAATKRIQLRRASPPSVQTFNYRAISRGAQLLQDPILQEGDVILVPERRLFE